VITSEAASSSGMVEMVKRSTPPIKLTIAALVMPRSFAARASVSINSQSWTSITITVPASRSSG